MMDAITMGTTAERVWRGVEILDRRRPGWENEIDLGTLFVGSPVLCVLGQIFGRYETGLDWLAGEFEGGEGEEADRIARDDAYGFTSTHENETTEAEELESLTGLWRREIARRIEARTSSVAESSECLFDEGLAISRREGSHAQRIVGAPIELGELNVGGLFKTDAIPRRQGEWARKGPGNLDTGVTS